MNSDEKISQLRSVIERLILPNITNDYVLYDLPYHANIGDILIWEGELDLLKKVPYKCLDQASRLTCQFPILSEDIVILFHGGGNMGDLYHEHVEFLIELTRVYIKNKILVFPQTFYYADSTLLVKDMKTLIVHPQLVLCARDLFSYSLIKNFFHGRILLVPDMSFYMNISKLKYLCYPQVTESLYIVRMDNELKNLKYNFDPSRGLVRDWPTFYHNLLDGLFIAKVINRISTWKFPLIGKSIDKIWNWYAFSFFRKDLIKLGVRFISPYSKVYTTRLHGCILAILLDKDVVLFDNAYGKNLGFYTTWLSDVETVIFIR